MKQIAPEYLEPSVFEKFSADLIQIMFRRKMYTFSDGKDEGIDGIDDMRSPKLILQAKRYQARMSPSNVLKTVESEIKKIKKTKIRHEWGQFHYVFVTSSGLLPRQREKLLKDYKEFFPSGKYIIDRPQLERLSKDSKYKEVFTQYGLVEKNLAEQVRELNLESIDFESQGYFMGFDNKYFVNTQVLDEAYDVLNSENIVVLSGNPGVGKSTNSRMLGLLFSKRLDGNYRILERGIDDIQEVINLYISGFKNSASSLVVVFDDFLGRNTLAATDTQMRNVAKIYRIAMRQSNLYLILNSRVQILNEAIVQNVEFKIFFGDLEKKREEIVIDVANISPNDKAKIVRKNLEMSRDTVNVDDGKRLSRLYDDIRVNKGYRKIVNNKNFNPRLIEQISKNWGKVPISQNFLDYILGVLRNPKELYDELFERFTIPEKQFLLVLNSFKTFPVSLFLVELSFQSLGLKYVSDVKFIEERLERSWISVTLVQGKEFIDFVNPSIVDYFQEKINGMSVIESEILNKAGTLVQLYNSDYSRFKEELINKFYNYPDRNEFIGDRIHWMNEQELTQQQFSALIRGFSVEDRSYFSTRISSCGWKELISDISHLKVSFQRIFIDDILNEETQFIDENSSEESFESNLLIIENMLRNIYGKQETLQKNEYFFSDVREAMISRIEDKLDDSDIIYDVAERVSENDYYDDEDVGKAIQSELSDYIQNIIDDSNFSEGISVKTFELDSLIQNVIESINGDDEDNYGDYDQNFSKSGLEADLIDDILNKPL